MKFPTVTVVLVSAALIYVVWDQTREQPAPLDAQRFGDLAANPVERGAILDWVSDQVPRLCAEATGQPESSAAVADCVGRSDKLQPTCRRAAYDRYPEFIGSDTVFQSLSLDLMGCLVRDSRPLSGQG